MMHLSEEELIAHAYGEGETPVMTRHLEECAACSKIYAAIESDLSDMRFAEPPDRGAGYGHKIWASLCGSLPAYESAKWKWLRGDPWRALSYTAACVLLLACTFAGGRLWERKHAHRTAKISSQSKEQQVAHAPQTAGVVVVVLSDHLDRSERLLVELKHADAGSIDMTSPLREEARGMLAANRICRQNARQQDDPRLAAALDHLDHLLEGLANQPGGLNAATLARLQTQANADGLLFEVRVLRSQLPDQQATATGHTKGGTI
jgi:hypothetical protein